MFLTIFYTNCSELMDSNSKYKKTLVSDVFPPLLFYDRFSEVHKFVKPNDEIALSLMNLCAASILEEFPHIVFAYGFSNEYR